MYWRSILHLNMHPLYQRHTIGTACAILYTPYSRPCIWYSILHALYPTRHAICDIRYTIRYATSICCIRYVQRHTMIQRIYCMRYGYLPYTTCDVVVLAHFLLYATQLRRIRPGHFREVPMKKSFRPPHVCAGIRCVRVGSRREPPFPQRDFFSNPGTGVHSRIRV